MASSFSRLIQHTGLYAVGNILVKASGLLLAGLYLDTTLLSQKAYGYLSLLEATGQVAILVAGMGVAMGLLKYLTDPAFEADHADLPFTALGATLVLALAVAAVFWWGAAPITRIVIDADAPLAATQLLGLYVAFKVLGQIPFTLLRTEERVGWYVVATLAEVVVLLGGVYYALAIQQAGLVGVMVAQVGAAAGSGLVLTLGMAVHMRWRFRPALIRPLMHYGAPLVLAGLASRFLNLGDKYLLNWLTDAEVLAIYAWATKLGGVINMLFAQSFQLAFSVLGLKTLGQGDVSLHRRAFRHYCVWAGWAVLGLSLLSYDVTRLVGDPIYLTGDVLVFPVALGFMAFGVHVVVNNVLYAAGRTRTIGANVFGAAVLNAVLNLLLIPYLGAMGAAVATFISYVALALMAAHVAEREVHVGYPWRSFVLAVGLVVVLYLAAWPTQGWSVAARLAVRGGVILAYWPLVLVLRLYTVDEVRGGLQGFRRWLREKRKHSTPP